MSADEQNPQPKRPSTVGVSFFRTTFFWPLTLVIPPNVKATKKLLDIEIDKLVGAGVWKRVPNLSDHLGDTEKDEKLRREAYAERIYFHDFVQKFLFPSANAKDAMTLLQRHDIPAMRVCLDEQQTFSLKVDRLCLYIAPVGVAMLVLEISCEQDGLTLQAVQGFNSRMRRAHTPFYIAQNENEGDKKSAAACWEIVHSVDLISTQCQHETFHPSSVPLPTDLNQGLKPYEHWQALLNPKSEKARPFWGQNRSFNWSFENTNRKPFWRHVSDDRLPILSAIRLADEGTYRSMEDGNWMRTCFVDLPGSDEYPYSSDFLKAIWPRHHYDRHHVLASESTDAPSRFLMCGYAMTAVGCNHDINFFKDHIQTHMQRHYFQMMLIIQLEMATMLSFSSRITHVVDDFSGTSLGGKKDRAKEEKLAEDMQQIERDFLNYTHRFKFTGISNQQQAIEMYDKLRDVTGLDKLYEDIKNELTTATAFLSNVQSERRAEAAEGLNLIAAMGVGLSIGIGLAALSDDQGNSYVSTLGFFGDWPLFSRMTACIAASTGVVGLVLFVSDWLRERQLRLKSSGFVITILAFLLCILAMGSNHFKWPAIARPMPDCKAAPTSQACLRVDGKTTQSNKATK